MRPRTLATRFLLVVALGAVLPLALVGLWLTRSAERSGLALLRTQLEHSADAIAASIDRRWTLRDGELRLLAANSVAPNVVSGSPISPSDSMYLLQLARSLSNAIPSVTYLDGFGRERWSFIRAADQSVERGGFTNALARGLPVELPITLDGRVLGRVVASVSISSVFVPESGQASIPGAIVAIADGRGVQWTNAPESVDLESPMARNAGWEAVSRDARVAPLRITVAAPSASYVLPFQRAARAGLGVLLVVVLVAVMASVIVTRRVARELAHQRALAAVGEFAASLSHEVRNSLTAVRVDLQHATRHLRDDGPGTPLVARALESVRRLDVTVSGALRVARTGQATRSRVDLDAVLRSAMRSAEPSFVEHGALLEPMAERPQLTIDGDAAALEQLFLNLLINAAQASPEGGSARVELQSTPANVIIKVIDGGPGIDHELSSPLGFTLRSTKPHGTGLGLPIARRIAIAHGGELTFETGPNAGTTAMVRLPVPT